MIQKQNHGRLETILLSLGKSTLKQVAFYIHSDQHGYPGEISVLFDVIHRQIIKSQNLPKNEELLLILNKQGKYSPQDIRLYKSYITRCVEQILVMEEVEKSFGLSKLLLYSAYNRYEMNELGEKSYENSLSKIENGILRNTDFYDIIYRMESVRYKYNQNASRKDYDFNRLSSSFDKFFISEKLRIASLRQTYKGILGTDYTDDILPFILAYLDTKPSILQEPAVAIYLCCYQCSAHPEEVKWFEELYKWIQNSLAIFPKDEQRDIILFANNFCIKRINKGESAYLEKSFELYRLGIETGSLLEKGYLSRFTYKNIVTLGIRLNQFEWTEHFIENNQKLLEQKYQHSSYCYNRAYFEHAKQNYDAAITLLNQADHDDYFTVLSSKNLLLKIYYQLEYIDSLEYLLGSIGAYLKRKNIEKIYKDNYNNIISCTRKLLTLKQLTLSQKKSLSQRKQTLKKTILQTEPLTEKKWLLEMLDKLK